MNFCKEHNNAEHTFKPETILFLVTIYEHKEDENNNNKERRSCYNKDKPPMFISRLSFVLNIRNINEDVVSWIPVTDERVSVFYC